MRGTKKCTKSPPNAKKSKKLITKKSVTNLLSPFLQDLIRPYMLGSCFAITWIKLSMVNKSFHDMIFADLCLWRSIFFDSVFRYSLMSWTTNYIAPAMSQFIEYKRRFNLEDRSPKRLEATTDVAPASFYKKAVQVWHLRTCGACGTKNHYVCATWVLGMQLCRPCAQANLASHEVLWEVYGLSVYSSAPSFAKTPALLAIEDTAPIITWLPMRVWFFKTSTTKTARKVYSNDPRDFTYKHLETPFFWKPHLARYLDMSALQVWAREKKTAAKFLTAVLQRNYSVKLRNNKKYRKNQVEVVSILKMAEIARLDPATRAFSTMHYTQIHHGNHSHIFNNYPDTMPDPWLANVD